MGKGGGGSQLYRNTSFLGSTAHVIPYAFLIRGLN